MVISRDDDEKRNLFLKCGLDLDSFAGSAHSMEGDYKM